MAHGKLRPVQSVQPGWWVLTYTDTGAEDWIQIGLVLERERIRDGARFVQLFGKSALDGETVDTVDQRGQSVQCCTATEAKRAGLAVPS